MCRQFPIQLACVRTIHQSQGLTLNILSFDLSGISTHGLVYTTLSHVTKMESLYLFQKLTQKKFCVNKKVLEETKYLRTEGSWNS